MGDGEKNAGMLRAMREMEEYEKKHQVAANRGRFFAADPPTAPNKQEEFIQGCMAEEGTAQEMYNLKNRLIAEYAAKRAEWEAPPKVEGFTGVSGDTTPLHSAAQYGDLDVLQRLIENGQSPNEVSPGGLTPLLMAARHGQDHVVKWLMLESQPRGDYTQRDPDGNTVHCLAARNGHTSTVQFFMDLLKKEFDMKESRRLCELQNNQGCTPMFLAAQHGQLHTVRYLVEIESGINKPRDDGATPLFIAAYKGFLDIVKNLVEEGRAEIDFSRKDGRQPCPGNSDESSPIRAAHRMGQFEIVQYLFGK